MPRSVPYVHVKLAMRRTIWWARATFSTVSKVPRPDKAKYLARLGTGTLRNGNELEGSGFTITPLALNQKFLNPPLSLPHEAEAPLEELERIPQGPRHIHSKTKRMPGKHVKTPYIWYRRMHLLFITITKKEEEENERKKQHSFSSKKKETTLLKNMTTKHITQTFIRFRDKEIR